MFFHVFILFLNAKNCLELFPEVKENVTSEASFSFLLKAAAAGMLLALLKFVFSSIDSTEEKDYFQIVRE